MASGTTEISKITGTSALGGISLSSFRKFLQAPYEYEFPKAVHFLQKIFRTSDPSNKPSQILEIRFHASVRYAHSSAEIEKVLFEKRGDNLQPILRVNFTGVAGIQGPLPLCYTEKVIRNSRSGDKALESFLNIFNNRMARLLYECQKVLPGYDSVPPLQSTLGQLIISFGGIEPFQPPKPGQKKIDPSPEEQKVQQEQQNLIKRIGFYLLSYKMMFWQKVRSSANLQQILSSFLGAKVSIEEHLADFVQLSDQDITRIGLHQGQLNTLGQDALLGCHVWRQNSRIRITIYDLEENYALFNPHAKGEKLQHLQYLCRLYVPSFIKIQLFIKINQKFKKHSVLGKDHFLGYDTWLGTKPIAQEGPRFISQQF